ncbi:hypothetical protein BZA05DRAFT_408657 [Tricharina praecox]|uniref:uncharacterized protein n=1 Tax=Tricharina praecox TaxID=43433 RepID=UPI00221F87C4|nr:uncharacterized protein BZA05DRAFT_408657 [Tricharina praecox]KAI5844842.1 hypothetical protein BZA05DRAFT_408657 [Tricharina praecox]
MSHYHAPSTSRHQPLLPEFSDPDFSPTARFNPKAVTQAFQAARNAAPKPAQHGPFINLDASNSTLLPRPALREGACPVSKKLITIARYVSIFLRLLQLLGAMGLLVCLLFIREIEFATGWICRVPPAVAVVHLIYALYHLTGSYRLKTPGSSKVYFLLASALDVALISLYTYIGILSWRQHAAGADRSWSTIFHEPSGADATIVFSVFLLVCCSGGLKALTLGLSLYLIHCFRQLEVLPPDHNPFVADEDPRLAVNEKSQRWSTSTRESEAPLGRKVPFAATRAAPNKHTYQTLDIDSIDFGESRARKEVLGAGYGQAEQREEDRPESPASSTTAPSLKRGSRVVRPLSISSMPGKPMGLKKNAYIPPPPSDDEGDVSVPIGGWAGTGGSGVQGYSKAALLQKPEARLRTVSGEAH